MDKSTSFSSRNVGNGTPKHRDRDSEVGAGQYWEGEDQEPLHYDLLSNLSQVLDEVDHFLHIHNNTATIPPPEVKVPDCVLALPKMLDCMIHKYHVGRQRRNPEDDNSFLQTVDRISKLSTTLSAFPFSSDSTASSSSSFSSALHNTSSVLDKAMFILEKELCSLLQDPKTINNYESQSKTPKKFIGKKSASFGSLSDLSSVSENQSPTTASPDEEEFPAFSPEKVSILNKIATAMITAGYQTECCMVFSSFRRNAFKTTLLSLGYASVSMEEIQRMQWESLEGEIAIWKKVVQHCCTVLFNAERRFYDSVFPHQPSISQILFGELARPVIIRFLNFAEGVALTKRSAEKLFKFLDMYETLRDLQPGIDDSYPEQCAQELAYETATAKDRIAEAAAGMFCDLENSIKSDNEKIPVPNGAVHPLTRYVMNYLKYACEYRDALEQVFQQRLNVKHNKEGIQVHHYNKTLNPNENKARSKIMEEEEDRGSPKNSPFSFQLMTIMDLLDANVERKSKLYRNPALRYVYLMNNGRYMVQKVKGSKELHESMGDNWCRRRQSSLRLFHKSYQRETWSKVLQCLNPEGLQGAGGNGNKVSKQMVKERFKSFNGMFEELHKTQSTWVVSDEQLQSELRVSVSALVIPAYRSFVGRFKHHLESRRQIDKYIKYQPEDIETLVDDLFGGNASSMSRKRT